MRVCELNSLAMLGRIPESRLIDLWTGSRARRIRSALAEGDLRMGCEECRAPLRAGRRDLAHASYYDRFPAPTSADPEWPRQLELSLSNHCNLQCVMCNGDLSSAIRTQREGLPPLPTVYDDTFFDDLALFLPHLDRVTFIGGEPFLGPESLRVFDLLRTQAHHVTCQVTTNGTVMTPRVERILADLPVEVSISLDGATAATYETIRVGASFERTLDNVRRFHELAAHLSLNYCLMANNWQEFGEFLLLGNDLGLRVHVNTVTAPHRFSLYHLAPEELDAVISHLERQAPDLGDLGDNQAVWDQQVSRLRAHLATLDATAADLQPVGSGTIVHATTTAVAIGLTARRLAADFADDRGVHDIDIGTSEQILAIHPRADDVLGMDLREHVGGHLTALVQALTSTFGDLVSTDLDYHAGGIEERTMTFERGGLRTTVRALQGAGDPDASPPLASRWHLAARSDTGVGTP